MAGVARREMAASENMKMKKKRRDRDDVYVWRQQPGTASAQHVA